MALEPRRASRRRAHDRRHGVGPRDVRRLATGQLFDGMEGWMPLFVDEQRTLLDEVHDATVVVVEPDRVSSRLADLLDEERELTDAVAATWQATSQIPLLHADWSRSSKDVSTSRWTRRSPGRPVRSISRRRRSSRATLRASPRTFVGGRRNVEGWCSRRTPRPSSAWPTNCAAKVGGHDRRHQGARRAPQRARELAGVGLQHR